jgi:hypothetical protein
MNRGQDDANQTRNFRHKNHDRRKSMSSAKEDCTNLVCLPRYREEIDDGELTLRRVNFRWVTHTFTISRKLEKVKISRKLFRQLNKHQVNDLARVIAGDETWVDFENPRSAICRC